MCIRDRLYSQRQRLRPPGALDEKDFLGSCLKCGQCVQVCPVQAIKLTDLVDGWGVGVPYIDAREQACDFSCDAVQCILACPTGSLAYQKPSFLPVRPGAALAAKPVLLAKQNDPEPTLNLKAVSYTHLDVYKRQTTQWACTSCTLKTALPVAT